MNEKKTKTRRKNEKYDSEFKQKVVLEVTSRASAITDISNKYGIDRNLIKYWCSKSGLSKKEIAEFKSKGQRKKYCWHNIEFKKQIVGEIINGFTSYSLSMKYKISDRSIRKWCEEQGVIVPKKIIKYSQDFKLKLLSEYAVDNNVSQLSKKYNINPPLIRSWVREARIKKPDKIQKNKFFDTDKPIRYKKRDKGFINQVIAEIDSGIHSINSASRKYEIESSVVRYWYKKNLSGNSKVESLLISNQEENLEKDLPDTITENIELKSREYLIQEIKRLKEAVSYNELKITSLETVINVAERDLNINIRKKSGARQSKK